MSLHYSGLIICSLCVGKGCQWRQEVVPKVAQLKQRLRLLPWHPDTGDPTASSAHGGHPIQDRAKSPNIGMLDRGYLFIYLFFFHSWVKPRKAAQPWERGRSIIISSRGGWGLEQPGIEYCDSCQMQTDGHVRQAGTGRLRGIANVPGSLGYWGWWWQGCLPFTEPLLWAVSIL